MRAEGEIGEENDRAENEADDEEEDEGEAATCLGLQKPHDSGQNSRMIFSKKNDRHRSSQRQHRFVRSRHSGNRKLIGERSSYSGIQKLRNPATLRNSV